MPVPEASSEETPYGRYITSDGWFVLNLGDALAVRDEEKGGATYPLESREHPFRDVGVRVTVIPPGQPSSLYHSEAAQEGFLVLSGECISIVEGEERRMGLWDYLHCPPGTAHITIGAGDGPCAILMVGTRASDSTIHYPVEPAAAKYDASVDTATDSPKDAYAGRPPSEPARSPWPLASSTDN